MKSSWHPDLTSRRGFLRQGTALAGAATLPMTYRRRKNVLIAESERNHQMIRCSSRRAMDSPGQSGRRLDGRP
jgi:hypothetical protein